MKKGLMRPSSEIDILSGTSIRECGKLLQEWILAISEESKQEQANITEANKIINEANSQTDQSS